MQSCEPLVADDSAFTFVCALNVHTRSRNHSSYVEGELAILFHNHLCAALAACQIVGISRANDTSWARTHTLIPVFSNNLMRQPFVGMECVLRHQILAFKSCVFGGP
jgi:hypothetical protein